MNRHDWNTLAKYIPSCFDRKNVSFLWFFLLIFLYFRSKIVCSIEYMQCEQCKKCIVPKKKEICKRKCHWYSFVNECMSCLARVRFCYIYVLPFLQRDQHTQYPFSYWFGVFNKCQNILCFVRLFWLFDEKKRQMTKKNMLNRNFQNRKFGQRSNYNLHFLNYLYGIDCVSFAMHVQSMHKNKLITRKTNIKMKANNNKKTQHRFLSFFIWISLDVRYFGTGNNHWDAQKFDQCKPNIVWRKSNITKAMHVQTNMM